MLKINAYGVCDSNGSVKSSGKRSLIDERVNGGYEFCGFGKVAANADLVRHTWSLGLNDGDQWGRLEGAPEYRFDLRAGEWTIHTAGIEFINEIFINEVPVIVDRRVVVQNVGLLECGHFS